MYFIQSSQGELTADEQGNVVSITIYDYADNHTSIENIVRFDFDEWLRFYQEPLAGSFDILDLGLWLRDGSYIPADCDWTETVMEILAS